MKAVLGPSVLMVLVLQCFAYYDCESRTKSEQPNEEGAPDNHSYDIIFQIVRLQDVVVDTRDAWRLEILTSIRSTGATSGTRETARTCWQVSVATRVGRFTSVQVVAGGDRL